MPFLPELMPLPPCQALPGECRRGGGGHSPTSGTAPRGLVFVLSLKFLYYILSRRLMRLQPFNGKTLLSPGGSLSQVTAFVPIAAKGWRRQVSPAAARPSRELRSVWVGSVVQGN